MSGNVFLWGDPGTGGGGGGWTVQCCLFRLSKINYQASQARNIVPNLGLDIQALRQKHKIGISKYLKFFKIHKNKEFPVNFFCRDKDKVNKN